VECRLLAITLALACGGVARRWEAAIRASRSAVVWVRQALLVSAAVQIGLLLPMVVYFHRISVTGLLANVIVTPLISMAIPAGFGALILNEVLLARLAGWLMGQAQRLAAVFAEWEPDWPVPDPPVWLAVVFVTSLLLTVLVLGRDRRMALAALAGALAAGGAVVIHPFAAQQVRDELELTLLDTGQSESLLLGLPQGGFVLIDAGGTAGRPEVDRRFDAGEDLIAPYLWKRGIRRLEAMVLTHLHEDHAGGAPFLIRSFRPAVLWTGYMPDHPSWHRVQRAAKAAGAAVRAAGEGSRWNWGGVEARVLAPSPEQRWRGKPSNNDSLVLELSFGRRRFLLTGDAERGVGDRLAEDGLLKHADVLKVAHHGARSALSHALLEKTRPALALISAGWQNPFGFPHPETLEALRAQRSIPLRTDLLGTVTVRTDGRTLTYESHPPSGL
jgi:competence protein ComEC